MSIATLYPCNAETFVVGLQDFMAQVEGSECLDQQRTYSIERVSQAERTVAVRLRRGASLIRDGVLFSSIALLCSGFAIAQSTELKMWDFAHDKKRKCSEGTMVEMNSCLAAEYAESDARLNLVYKHLIEALAAPASLKRAQTAWVRFRDLQCAFEVPPAWTGSAIPYTRNACLIDHTERRIRDLERVGPCNGCVEFKDQYYGGDKPYELPPRR